MEVEGGQSVREEVNFLIATQSLEGKWRGQETHKDFYWQEMPHPPLGKIYTDNRGTKRRSSPLHSATKMMWRIGDNEEPNSTIWFLTWDDEPSKAKEIDHFSNFVGKVLHAQAFYLQASLSQMSTVPGTKLSFTSKILPFLWRPYFLLPHIGVLFKAV